MNYLTRNWSQVQNIHKNVMTIDISELTLMFYINEIPISSQ